VIPGDEVPSALPHLLTAAGAGVVRTIRADRRVRGVDLGIARCTGQTAVRFENTALLPRRRAVPPQNSPLPS